jgi:hypothetical protein
MSEFIVESRFGQLRGSVPVRFGSISGRFEEVETVLDWWPGDEWSGEFDELLNGLRARGHWAPISRRGSRTGGARQSPRCASSKRRIFQLKMTLQGIKPPRGFRTALRSLSESEEGRSASHPRCEP